MKRDAVSAEIGRCELLPLCDRTVNNGDGCRSLGGELAVTKFSPALESALARSWL